MSVHHSFLKNKSSIVTHYTLYSIKDFPKCPAYTKTVTGAQLQIAGLSQTGFLDCLRTQMAHIACPESLTWHPSLWVTGKGGNAGARPPPSVNSQPGSPAAHGSNPWEICLVVKPPALEQSTSSPAGGQQVGPNKTPHLRIIDFFWWPPTLATEQFSAQTNNFHKCFQGVLWNSGSEDY